MEFLQPVLLWGIGAVSIPIVIHFWHQKKGRTLAWAATRWLQEKDQPPQRGVKLEDLLLLVIRCLLHVLLAVLLSQPVVNWFAKPSVVPKVHLVQPEKRVIDNFRFELEEAIKKSEAIYWINASTALAKTPNELPEEQVFNSTQLQSSINKLAADRSELQLYLMNNQQLADLPFIRIPASYKLHTFIDSVNKPKKNYLKLTSGQNVFINPTNQLVNRPVLEPINQFQTTPAHVGAITVLVNYQNKTEEKTVLAAIQALSEVYSLNLSVDTQTNSTRNYDWILTDQEVNKPLATTLYIVSGKLKIPTTSNVIYTEERLSPKTAEMVGSGQLPEWLGAMLIWHFKLNLEVLPLSQDELKALFVTVPLSDRKQPESFRTWMLLAFIGLVGMERWVALTKNT
ncbi:BatA domain-containing protein [Larkinella terrae]|uniref:Aerotolerance regulator N-terminal domain-containing protein n=1 Tax=Larkinella terrae TaxID=2025311 RepID=A0A7K0EVS4_9BACT|nr:BatA domain-containing protein [Larkinella terrae]MRS65676.1 hypothetical protein [Larkinella terrae]